MSVEYTRTEVTGPCQYEVWHKERKRLGPCGAPGHKWKVGESSYRVTLCDEHAAFVMDARGEVAPEGSECAQL